MNSSKKIVIAGGSGMIGTHLSHHLDSLGYNVCWLSRSHHRSKYPVYTWDLDTGRIDAGVFDEPCHFIVLNGSGIADKRWTAARKKVLRDSRIVPHQVLIEGFRDSGMKPVSYIAIAGTGYYGDSGDQVMHEDQQTSNQSFLTKLSRQWEAAHGDLPEGRHLTLRVGVVLTRRGGALPPLMGPLKFGVQPILGSGKQWMSWIHPDDLARMIAFFLKGSQEGVYNAVSPQPVTHREFMKTLANRFRISIPVRIPAFFLKLGLGEMAQAVLDSNRVSSGKVQDAGFEFRHAGLKETIEHILENDL